MAEHLDERALRWASEAAHTDEWLEGAGPIEPIHPLTWQRYSSPPFRKSNSRELPFSVVGDLTGKRVLDVACGEGIDSVTLAKLGAEVTGVDVSKVAIERARARAKIDGVAERTRFLCSPLETADLAANHFDVIWCWAFLHHLVSEFQPPVETILATAKPGGLFIFSEPVNLAPWLRDLRLRLFAAGDATPDERPLEKAELEVLHELIPDLELRVFRFLGRLNRFVLVNPGYEFSPWPRRKISDMLGLADYFLLKIPGLTSLCSVAVGWGHVRK